MVVVGLALSVCIIKFGGAEMGTQNSKLNTSPPEQEQIVDEFAKNAVFDASGRFIMNDYDVSRPFASFLNGLSGLFGVPMWAFYVNRGQGIAAFGTENKQHPISEFKSANYAYQQIGYTGFRTFVRMSRGNQGQNQNPTIYQPFFPREEGQCASREDIERDLKVGMNDMEITERAHKEGLTTTVNYFTLPTEPFAALVRRTTLTNIGNDILELDAIDGLAKLEPFGVDDFQLKSIGRTLEGWFDVFNFQDSDNTMPFFKLSASVSDSEEVNMVTEGNWVMAFVDTPGEVPDGTEKALLPIIADPTVVFDQLDSPLTYPLGLEKEPLESLLKKEQVILARTPSAFAAWSGTLSPGESVTIVSMYGRARNLDYLKDVISPTIRVSGYTGMKHNTALKLMADMTSMVQTTTANPVFDGMIRQAYLDNLLRGGLPILLGADENGKNPHIYHTFNRIHGDLERDYNNFQLDLTYFSQGPGNFRDINQNRRLDVLITPEVYDFNIRTFLSLVQADGYNPLTVATAQFLMSDDGVDMLVASMSENGVIGVNDVEIMKELLSHPFRPGDLFQNLQMKNVTLAIDNMVFINMVTEKSIQVPQANMTELGNWADHWTYTLDLIENFLDVYPDQEEHVLYDSEPIPFFLSRNNVKSRDKKYVLTDEGQGRVRQYQCVLVDPAKEKYLQMHVTDPYSYWLRVGTLPEDFDEIEDFLADNVGGVFTVSPAAKLTLLAVVKFSTLDPYGMGIEMEGGKPGWNDAMNGLPGLIGSGMPETFELLRVLRFMTNAQRFNRDIEIPVELDDLIKTIMSELDAYNNEHKDDFKYWDRVASAREKYRERTNRCISGVISSMPAVEMRMIFKAMAKKIETGIERSIGISKGMTPTYFSYTVTDWSFVKDANDVKTYDALRRPFVLAKALKVNTYAPFLEGPVRHLKILTTEKDKALLYNKVTFSEIYDSKLNMYKICAPLTGASFEIGRMIAFPRGWLENESVWLHMSYKWYLELLRAGLYDAFWAKVQYGISAFMDPAVYGRSPLEAASFIVSSAFPDEQLHGSGFLARLSGSTAELLSMWAIMFIGQKPFFMNEHNELNLRFNPSLPAMLFPESTQRVSFVFLGRIRVEIVNPTDTDTWKLGNLATATLRTMDFVETTLQLEQGVIPVPYAESIRSGKIASISLSY